MSNKVILGNEGPQNGEGEKKTGLAAKIDNFDRDAASSINNICIKFHIKEASLNAVSGEKNLLQLFKDLFDEARQKLLLLQKGDADKAFEVLKGMYNKYKNRLTESFQTYGENQVLFAEKVQGLLSMILAASLSEMARFFSITKRFNAYLSEQKSNGSSKNLLVPSVIVQVQHARVNGELQSEATPANSSTPSSSKQQPIENRGGIQMTGESRKDLETALGQVQNRVANLEDFYNADRDTQGYYLNLAVANVPPYIGSKKTHFLHSQLITDLDAYLREYHSKDEKYSRPKKPLPLLAFVAALGSNKVEPITTNFYVPDSAQAAASIRRAVPPEKRLDATNPDVKRVTPTARSIATWAVAGALVAVSLAPGVVEHVEHAAASTNGAYEVSTYMAEPISQAWHDALHMSSPHTELSQDQNYGPDYNAQRQEAMKSVGSLFAFVQDQVVNPDAVKAVVNPNPEVERKHYDAKGNFVEFKTERVSMPSRARLYKLLTKGEIEIMPGEIGVADAIAHAFIEAFPQSKAQISEFLDKFNKTSALYYVNRSLNQGGALDPSEQAYLERAEKLGASLAPKFSHVEQNYLHSLGITDADARAFGEHFQQEFNNAVIYDPGSTEGRPLGDLTRNVKPGTIIKTQVDVDGVDTNNKPYKDQLTFVRSLAAIVNLTFPKAVSLQSIETDATPAHNNVVGNAANNQVNTPLTPGSGVVIQPDAGVPQQENHPAEDAGAPDGSTDADKHGFLDLPKPSPVVTEDGIITYTAANVDEVLDGIESLGDDDYMLIEDDASAVNGESAANNESVDSTDEIVVDLDGDDSALLARGKIKVDRAGALFQNGEVCLPGKPGQPLDVVQVLQVVSDRFVQFCHDPDQMKAVDEYLKNKGAGAFVQCEKLTNGEVYAQLHPATLKTLHALVS